MTKIHRSLHEIEDQLIEVKGLASALQQVLPDGSAHTCVTNALTEKIERLEQDFYSHWESLFAKHQNQSRL